MTTAVAGPVVAGDYGEVRLLDDKLRVPRPGLAVLRRGRVEALLESAASRRVTLVTGPAGAGKTVACACWASAAASRRCVAWLTLDSEDAEPCRFWRYVTAALTRAGALAVGTAEKLRGTAPAEFPHRLCEAVAAGHERAVLVLDDLHELAGAEVTLGGLDELIKHAPAELSLLLVGRYAPGLALSKLRILGELGDVGEAELACSEQEAEAYFGLRGAAPGPADVAAALRHTEGWMAGLRLVSMAAQAAGANARPPVTSAAQAGQAWHPGDGRGLRAALDSGEVHDLATDYLCDEVLGRLPADTRRFMLRTCLTDTVPASLAQALTGEVCAAAVLDQLSREIGLIQPVRPDHDGAYRYHPMLREALNRVLRRELPDEVPSLLGKVARWQASRGEALAAISAAAVAGDWDFGLRVLGESGPAILPPASWTELDDLLSTFPADRRESDVSLAAALAAARLWQGDADGALPHLDSAEGGLARLAPGSQPGVRLWLAALRVMRRASQPDAEPSGAAPERELARRAHEAARTLAEHRGLGLLWLALGCAALREFDFRQARSALLHASSQLSAGGMARLRERARSFEAVACACYGDLAGASRLVAAVADGPHGRDADLAPVLALSQARVHLTRNELDAAGQLLDQADQAAVAQPAGEPSIAWLTGIMRAEIAITDGNLAGARGLVRWLTEAAAGERAAGQAIAVLSAQVSLAAGERERARATLDGVAALPRGDDPQKSPAAGGRPCPPAGATVCRARLEVADADDKAALSLIEPVICDAAGLVTLTDRLAALLTAVIAHRSLSQPAEAAERLEEALALAEPDEACGPFVAAGPPVRSALTVLIRPPSRCAGFAARILDQFDGQLPRASHPSGAPLTESELAVLRFLPSHMTNQEIAESLFLSINTIKTHLSSVYRKLGVVNRRQAIAQGRRLDLL
jgi:LuxR family transcriptional regulator, maltose regulon positive regulatory protein